MRLQAPVLMLVTDRQRCGPLPLLDAIRQAVGAGIGSIQLREKDLRSDQLYELALQCRQITAGRCLFLVNSRVDVALAAGADGVHLPERDLSVQAVRRLAPPGFLIGCSVHSAAAAGAAADAGADYVELGTIFATESKPGLEGSGVSLIRQSTKSLHIPCLAIGGIDATNAASVMAAGASGIAVVSAILQAEDIAAAVSGLRSAIAITALPSPGG